MPRCAEPLSELRAHIIALDALLTEPLEARHVTQARQLLGPLMREALQDRMALRRATQLTNRFDDIHALPGTGVPRSAPDAGGCFEATSSGNSAASPGATNDGTP